MNFIKRKAITKKPKFTIANYEEFKTLDIKVMVTMEDVPEDLVVNWDQIAIKYLPLSNLTMAQESSKRVEVFEDDDKGQIIANFAASLSGNFLPVQIVYEGKTTKCHLAVKFPRRMACDPYIKSLVQ